MIFTDHSRLKASHAFLSPSNYHWSNYDEDKLLAVYSNAQQARRGTELHDFAQRAITLGIKQADNGRTLNTYVNDAIGYKMTPEQTFLYSENCYGHADTAAFRNNKLRIHDLKTGVIPGHMRQLEIYAALFCLEYGFKPQDIEIELRIYQNDQVLVLEPEFDDIVHLQSTIIRFDHLIESMKGEEYR